LAIIETGGMAELELVEPDDPTWAEAASGSTKAHTKKNSKQPVLVALNIPASPRCRRFRA
jgi:hypothetical protein